MSDNVLGSLTVNIKAVGTATVITASGDVDLTGSPLLRQELKKAAAPGKRIVVDLSAVPYMDSSGLATLVEALQNAKRIKSEIVICGLSDRVRSIFTIAKLETVFKLVGTVEQALA